MKPVATDGGLRIAGTGTDRCEQAVVATFAQLFTGLRVGMSTLEVQCCGCGRHLREGNRVSVYAYRTVETPRWHLARCRCLECGSAAITAPTLGATEVCVRARLAVVSDKSTQQHHLCLAKPTVSAVSPPQDGTPP